MDSVLKQLESRVEELIEAYRSAQKKQTELTARVEELEAQAAEGSELGDKVAELEKQRADLGARLEKVLKMVDGTLAKAADR